MRLRDDRFAAEGSLAHRGSTRGHDRFAPRGIQTSCHSGPPAGRNFDPYGALQFLSDRSFVDSGNVALMGFSEGGLITLFDIELQADELDSLKFRAAIALYPTCAGSGIVTVPTLVLNGQLDDWSSFQACEKMVAQENDVGITRHKGASAPMTLIMLPGAYQKFDAPKFQPGRLYMGHFLQYNAAALSRAAQEIHNFLRVQLNGHGQGNPG